MAYILVNPDNTLNWIGDEWENSLILEGVEIITVESKTSSDLLGDVNILDAAWDKDSQMIVSYVDNPEVLES
jgi:uncharacterized cupin superfamily protein